MTFEENGNQPQKNSSCPYKCAPELTDFAENQSCLENFDLFLNYIGGKVVFILAILGTVIVALFAIIILFVNKKRKNKGIKEH